MIPVEDETRGYRIPSPPAGAGYTWVDIHPCVRRYHRGSFRVACASVVEYGPTVVIWDLTRPSGVPLPECARTCREFGIPDPVEVPCGLPGRRKFVSRKN